MRRSADRCRTGVLLAALVLTGVSCSRGWVDPNGKPLVARAALEQSRFFTTGVLRDAPGDDAPQGDIGVRATLPEGVDPFDALVDVVDEGGSDGVSWTAASCIVGDTIILTGFEAIDGHDNPIRLAAERESGELTFAIESATGNSEPTTGTRSATVSRCASEQQAYLVDLVGA